MLSATGLECFAQDLSCVCWFRWGLLLAVKQFKLCFMCAFEVSAIKPLNPDSLPHYACALTFRHGEVCITFSEAEWLSFISTLHSLWVILKVRFTEEQGPRLFLTPFWSKMTVGEMMLYWAVGGFRPCWKISGMSLTWDRYHCHHGTVSSPHFTHRSAYLSGQRFGSCLRGSDRKVRCSVCVTFCCPPSVLGSDNLLLPRSGHSVALSLELRNPQRVLHYYQFV